MSASVHSPTPRSDKGERRWESQVTRVSGPRTEARFRSGDGEREATIFRPAVSDDRGALPIIVLAHGISGVKSHPRVETPALLSLYQAGRLNLDELITTKYRFEDINQRCQDMKEAKNIRGMVSYTDADR